MPKNGGTIQTFNCSKLIIFCNSYFATSGVRSSQIAPYLKSLDKDVTTQMFI